MNVRTRVAPSPTGDPHVGTAYVALVNYLFAKQNGGQFLLRIEDTDRARSTPESERVILDALAWLGLQWDEGPDVGGSSGPYRQSERLDIYAKHADELLVSGHAFRCFCTPDRLDAVRKEQQRASKPPKYDGHCLALSREDVARELGAGVASVVRLKVPVEGRVTIDDLLRGPIEFDWTTVDMQVLVKSDGWPTYHLANVVDDHLMAITHVMRGEEWISSAPKHLLLYRAFGWEMPELAHLPLLRNADRSKLSKRKNPTSILFYKRMGYLPEVLANFLGLLSVPPVEGEELMDMAVMIANFTLEKISLGGPIFDTAKLDWLNGKYLREKLDDASFAKRFREWASQSASLDAIVPLARGRIERLSDFAPLCGFLFAGRLDIAPEALRGGKLDDETLRKAFVLALAVFDTVPEWTTESAQIAVRRVGDVLAVKLRDVIRPFYVATTGTAQSIPLFESMAILGRDMVRERFRGALEKLGGATSAETERWKKLLEEPPLVVA